jgi:hypothetical protein
MRFGSCCRLARTGAGVGEVADGCGSVQDRSSIGGVSADAGAGGERVPVVYGLTARDGEPIAPPRWTVNRFGAEFGDLVWQVSAEYGAGLARPVSVHTVIRRRVLSAIGDRWVSSGVAEAKGLVAGELRAPVADIVNLPDRQWETTSFPVDGAARPAERLITDYGAGWVVELDSVVIGLVSLDVEHDSVGRIEPPSELLAGDGGTAA